MKDQPGVFLDCHHLSSLQFKSLFGFIVHMVNQLELGDNAPFAKTIRFIRHLGKNAHNPLYQKIVRSNEFVLEQIKRQLRKMSEVMRCNWLKYSESWILSEFLLTSLYELMKFRAT